METQTLIMADKKYFDDMEKRIKEDFNSAQLKKDFNRVVIDAKKAAEILCVHKETVCRHSEELGIIDHKPGTDHKFYLGNILVLAMNDCAGFKEIRKQLRNKL